MRIMIEKREITSFFNQLRNFPEYFVFDFLASLGQDAFDRSAPQALFWAELLADLQWFHAGGYFHGPENIDARFND